MMYLVGHETSVDEPLPDYWNGWWAHAMQPRLRDLYLLMRQPGYCTNPVLDADFARGAGRAKTRLYADLCDLEKMGFLGLFYDDDEHTTYVSVSSLPRPTLDDEDRAKGSTQKENMASTADKLVKLWKRDWEVTFEEAYTAPEGRDRAQAIRLLKAEPDTKNIVAVIEFYWKFAHEGEHKTFAGFVRDYDEYAAQKARLDRKMV